MSKEAQDAFRQLPKLAEDGSNYTLWITHIKWAFKASGGKFALEQKPSASNADEITLDEAIGLAITSLLPDNVYSIIYNKEHAFEILMVLKEHYEADNLAMTNALEAWFRQIMCHNPCEFDKMLNKLEHLQE